MMVIKISRKNIFLKWHIPILGILILIMTSSFALSIESSRIMLLKFNYENGRISIIDKEILYGYTSDRKYLDEGYKLDVLDGNNVLYSTKFKIPLLEYVEFYNSSSEMLEGSPVKYSQMNFSIAVPYYESADSIKVYNEKGFEIVNSGVSKDGSKDNGSNLAFVILLVLGVVIT